MNKNIPDYARKYFKFTERLKVWRDDAKRAPKALQPTIYFLPEEYEMFMVDERCSSRLNGFKIYIYDYETSERELKHECFCARKE